jgi:hypothetical protein
MYLEMSVLSPAFEPQLLHRHAMRLDPKLKRRLLDQDTWIRFAFMAFFVFVYSVVEIVIAVVVLLQFGSHLITGTDNPILRAVGGGLGKFVYQMVLFLTYNTDKKPFPFGNWEGSSRRSRRRRARRAKRARALPSSKKVE